MAISTFWGSLAGIVLVLALIAVVLYIIFKMGKSLIKVILGIVANSVLGILAIIALDFLFNVGIPLTTQAGGLALYTIIPTALFGLPAVGTMLILRLFGIVI